MRRFFFEVDREGKPGGRTGGTPDACSRGWRTVPDR